jgi:hypothetical protein
MGPGMPGPYKTDWCCMAGWVDRGLWQDHPNA